MKNRCHCHPLHPWIHHLILLYSEKLQNWGLRKNVKALEFILLKLKGLNIVFAHFLVFYFFDIRSVCPPLADDSPSESELLWITAVRLLTRGVWRRRLLLLVGCFFFSSSSS